MANKSEIDSVLIIDDDETFRLMLKTFLKKILPDVDVIFYDPVQQGSPKDDFNWQDYGLLMMDYDLGNDENGLDWLRKYKSNNNQFPATIMLTGHGNEEIAVEAMRFGAQDYINKTKLSLERLQQAVTTAVEKRQKQDRLSNTLTLRSNIFNKTYFYKMVKEVIENPVNDKFAFLLQVQINQYKDIYKKHGLLLTDNYVTYLTDSFAKIIQSENFKLNIVRMGDAIISCLIYDCQGIEAGEKTARMISELMKQPFETDNKIKIESSVTIGIVTLGEVDDVNRALDLADQTCQEAAKKGDVFHVYTKKSKEKQEGKGTTSKEPAATVVVSKQVNLADILKRNSIQPYFLPYIALSETATTFNASYFQMRMNLVENDGTTIDTDAIKGMDLMGGNPGMLDLWAARYALAQILDVDKEKVSRKCGLFIRLFEESLSNDKLFEWMKSLIKKSQVPNIASTVVFEMRPPEFIGHKKNALNFINNMRETWGVSFALYDVINSEVLKTCVKQAGFEFVKFTMNSDDLKSIEDTSLLARDLGALTVMEKINNAQELNTAIDLKFDYGQGDFIQPAMDKPVLIDDIIEI